ncbi:MAG: plastocyanin/azurin family copper-binding protein [Proteobacteria bacterium]|nr:plastocyanin/azurin family copper-binding protein [Pseudomonadota bacterium]
MKMTWKLNWKLMALTTLCSAGTSFAVCDTTKVVEISVKDMKFLPAHVVVCAGQTIRWTNNESAVGDPITHSVTADPARAQVKEHVALPEGAPTFHSKGIKPGLSWQYQFSILGDYKYICVPHELMGHLGSIQVVAELPPEAVEADPESADSI